MFGFFGTSVNAVFKVLPAVFILVLYCPFSFGANFHSTDIFSQSFSSVKEESIKPVLRENEHKILIFIDPHCPWCQRALQNLSQFKNHNSHWVVQVYVMASIQEFIDFFKGQGANMPSSLDYTLDFKNIEAETYSISQTPTYIIIKDGKIKKVEGYVDLAHFSLDSDYS
jgi:thioredoxin-related protein